MGPSNANPDRRPFPRPFDEDRERTEGASLLPNVNPTFSWVRLAQRVPVRIALDNEADREKLVSGRTATVFVENAALKKWSPFGL